MRNLLKSLFDRSEPAEPYRLPPGRRVYAIGDVHGRLDLLLAVERAVAAHAAAAPPVEEALAIFLGDYVDRGPYSAGVIGHLLSGRFAGLPARHVMGNHEDAMLAFLDDPGIGPAWLKHGGLATLRSYGVRTDGPDDDDRMNRLRHGLIEALPNSHRAFLAALELSIRIGGFLFVHAGIRPGRPIADQMRGDLLGIREPFLHFAGTLPCRVVHGHTIAEEPEILPGRIGLDTGAYASGRLTCAIIEDDRVEILGG
ncbi:MAG: metallophosphoesterase [Sphingomonas fennica]